MPPSPPKPTGSGASGSSTAAATPTTAGTAAKANADAPAELTAQVDELLNSLSTKFATVSAEMLQKMDAMSKRLDQMEAALSNSTPPAGK
ncbi:hypothetical protein DFH27DRAFT_605090 [Peziza echinospora]|nr:hypothetical protein DFH27DRAFT_605090 [Peziza echinospora]